MIVHPRAKERAMPETKEKAKVAKAAKEGKEEKEATGRSEALATSVTKRDTEQSIADLQSKPTTWRASTTRWRPKRWTSEASG